MLKEIGDQIRKLREDRGLTQTELARVAGVPQNTLNRLEHKGANITLVTLERILGVFGQEVVFRKKVEK